MNITQIKTAISDELMLPVSVRKLTGSMKGYVRFSPIKPRGVYLVEITPLQLSKLKELFSRAGLRGYYTQFSIEIKNPLP